ncbi:MAG: phosphohistidine phosphatase [Proteobacteria bacterium]|nr:phosphohistidine phosphatase [Pseudomonadota bacterium]
MTAQGPRRLTLVRHAKSDWGVASLDDFDRPLNKRGERDAPEMAARLAAAGLVPGRIITSPAVRALATAQCFAAALGCPASRIVKAQSAYLASAGQLLEVVRQHGGRSRHVMLVGHNPGISSFCVRLTGDDSKGDVPTCAVMSLVVPDIAWSRLDFGAARLDFYDFPKNHR